MLDILEHGEYFISLVQQNDLLWNKKNMNFKDTFKKNETWESIGSNFGITGEEALQIFTSLRQKYLREKDKETAVTRNGTGKPKKLWFLYNMMTFLDKVITPRRARSSLIISRSSRSCSGVCETITQEYENDSDVELASFAVASLPFSDSSSLTSPPSITSAETSISNFVPSTSQHNIAPTSTAQSKPLSIVKKHKRDRDESEPNGLISTKEAPITEQTLTSDDTWKVKDDVKVFCKYLGTKLNNLPDTARSDFENETLFNLYKLEKSLRNHN